MIVFQLLLNLVLAMLALPELQAFFDGLSGL